MTRHINKQRLTYETFKHTKIVDMRLDDEKLKYNFLVIDQNQFIHHASLFDYFGFNTC